MSAINLKSITGITSITTPAGVDNQLTLHTNNTTERFRIDSSGRLLIGTTTEGHGNADDLTIATTDHTGITLRSATNRSGSVFFSDGTSGADEYRGWIQYTHTSDYLTFGTAANEGLRIDNNGRLILGGSSAGPYHQDGDEFNIYSTGNTGMSIFSGTSSLGSIFFADGNNDVHQQRRGAIQYNHNGNYLSLWTNAAEKLRITSDGQVNIGGDYTQTNYPLQVNQGTDENRGLSIKNDEVGLNLGAHGSGHSYGREFSLNATRIDSGSLPFLRLGGQGGIKFCVDLNTERLRITSSGNVGINESSPNFKLHVNGTGRFESDLSLNSTSKIYTNNSQGQLTIMGGATYPGSAIKFAGGQSGATDQGTMIFYAGTATSLQERLRIKSDGNALMTGNSVNLDFKTTSAYSGNAIRFFDHTSTSPDGRVQYEHSSNEILFETGGNWRARLGSTYLKPESNNTTDLGTNSQKWKTLYLGTQLNIDAVAASSTGMIMLDNAGTNFARLGHNSASGVDVLDIRSDGHMRFLTGGNSEKVRIASTGNVSINTTNTSEGKLQVNGDITAGYHHGGDMYGLLAKRKFQGGDALGGYAIRYGSGYESPWIVGYNAGSSYDNQITFGSMTTSDRSLETGVTKRMVIDMETGKVGINDTTNGWAEKLQVSGDYNNQYAIVAKIEQSSGTLMRFGTTSGVCGSITGNGTNSAYNTSSDYRLKENDVSITDGISRVKQLRPIKFNWKTDPSTTQDGFFAHEVSPVVPESVTGEKDASIDEIGAGYQRIDHSKLVPLLTAALQEAISEIETLKTEVTALKGS